MGRFRDLLVRGAGIENTRTDVLSIYLDPGAPLDAKHTPR